MGKGHSSTAQIARSCGPEPPGLTLMALQVSGTRPSYLLMMRPQARGDQVTEPTPTRERAGCGGRDLGDGQAEGQAGIGGCEPILW